MSLRLVAVLPHRLGSFDEVESATLLLTKLGALDRANLG